MYSGAGTVAVESRAEEGHPGVGGQHCGCLPGPPQLPGQLRVRPSPRYHPPEGSDTHVTGLKGRLLRSD